MPARRSYFNAKGTLANSQLRRRNKDLSYATAHSRPNTRFVECSKDVASQVKAMVKAIVKAKERHFALDSLNGSPSHHGRTASLAARNNGSISPEEHTSKLKTF